jgi:tRNA nucleotidyltransferase/poly(A) polymerase
MNIRARIEKDLYNRIVFKKFPQALLVGGFIRELLRGKESKDRDYVLKEDPEIAARAVQMETGGTVVSMKDGLTVRLIPEEGASLDFTKIQGNPERDLSSRDFTINSIAYNPSEGIIDITGGVGDLERGIIRAVKEENITKDPVRIIRGYRFLSEIQGRFDEQTRSWLVRNRELLTESAPERITLEFIKTFRGEYFLSVLDEALRDGILNILLSLKNSTLSSIVNKLLEINKKIKVTPYELTMDILGEKLDLLKLLCLELLFMEYLSENSEKERLVIVPARLKGRIKGLERVADIEHLPESSEVRYSIYKKAWPSVFEFLLYRGRVDLFAEAEKFKSLTTKPLVSGERIMELRPEISGVELGRLIDEIRKGVFAGRLKDGKDVEKYIHEYKI